jgi:transcriptional regulator with XRE-family HTH domain
MYRKRSQLNLDDIAFLMQLPDKSSVSRWEQGQRTPSLDLLAVYHLLFDIPMETLLESHKQETATKLVQQIGLLLGELRKLPPSQKVIGRLSFLESVLTRLTTSNV